jgi:hypothetical protein
MMPARASHHTSAHSSLYAFLAVVTCERASRNSSCASASAAGTEWFSAAASAITVISGEMSWLRA